MHPFRHFLLRHSATYRHPWYHQFSAFGYPTPQRGGIFELNQKCKEPILTELIAEAAQDCPDGVGLELFCCDGLYSQIALRNGLGHMTGYDTGQAQCAGDPIHLRQARLMARLLATEGRATFYDRDVFTIEGSYDLVICAGGLYHLSNPASLLEILQNHTRKAMVLQTVVPLDQTDPDYFVSPAPDQNWGCRFSVAWLENTLRSQGWTILRTHFNELEANPLPKDRGSYSALCRPNAR